MLKKILSAAKDLVTPISKLSDEEVTERYLKAGAEVGSAIGPDGEHTRFEKDLNEWAKWEAEYVKRGFKAIPIEVFADSDFGFYKEKIKEYARVRRDLKKKPVYHAEIYRQLYLGKITPVLDLSLPVPQCGTYVVPTTMVFDKEIYD